MISEQGWARVRGVARRRKRAILVTAAVALAVAAPLGYRAAPGYRAQAVVRALESQPSHEYVAPTVAEPMGERLKTLRVAAMARPLLAEAANDLGLGATDEVVDGLRARMEVKVEGEDTFLLSYEDRDPGRAQAVVNRVAARFIAHEVGRRAAIAAATERALDGEVAALRPALSRLEAAVRDFKRAHYGSLPEQEEENLRTLDQTTLEIDIQAQNLDVEREHRRQLLAAATSPLRHQEDLLATALAEARTRYTADHPEVRRIAGELASLRGERIADERASQSGAGNPELASSEENLRRTAATLGRLRDRQAEVRARVAATAKSGEALTRMATDLDVVKAKYQAALGRLHEASLAAAVEKYLAPFRYELVESASRPRAAAAPQRAFFALAALALALALGLAVGFALDLADTSIHSPQEIAAALSPDAASPVLACVPDLAPHAERSPFDA